MSQLIKVPCILMRGGTSKGPFFNANDLPADIALRDQYLLAAMGSPDRRQIDGLGGAHSLTSKAGIVDVCHDGSADLTFLFAQLQPEKDSVDTTPNCGNMLAAVVPFAIESGLIKAQNGKTTVSVKTLNTNMVSNITVLTPNGQVQYDGDARIDGAPGTAAPIQIEFLDIAGSVCGALLPTGNLIDRFEIEGLGSIDVSCIDNGMPMVLIRASDLNRSANETVAQLNQDVELKTWLELLRLKAALAMGLGDVTDKNYPKMCLLSKPNNGGAINTRCFIPHVCHDSIGVLAAVTVGTACVLSGTIADSLVQTDKNIQDQTLSIEHPSGELTVVLSKDADNLQSVKSAALLRTARVLMKGEVYLPQYRLDV